MTHDENDGSIHRLESTDIDAHFRDDPVTKTRKDLFKLLSEDFILE